jgi:hypothetical protein
MMVQQLSIYGLNNIPKLSFIIYTTGKCRKLASSVCFNLIGKGAGFQITAVINFTDVENSPKNKTYIIYYLKSVS